MNAFVKYNISNQIIIYTRVTGDVCKNDKGGLDSGLKISKMVNCSDHFDKMVEILKYNNHCGL